MVKQEWLATELMTDWDIQNIGYLEQGLKRLCAREVELRFQRYNFAPDCSSDGLPEYLNIPSLVLSKDDVLKIEIQKRSVLLMQ